MQPVEFIVKWRKSELKERSASQGHFLDLCRMLDEATPAEADPSGQNYCFEKGATKTSGGHGWADVWKRGCFGWEYKGPHGNLDRALDQLRQYALALENPPLLVVCDTHRFRIQTNWTNSVSKMYEFELEELTEPRHRDRLKAVFSDPEKLRPGTTRQALTETAAATFAELAQALRGAKHRPETVARFVNRLVFCMFAEDVGLLPDNIFSRMLAIAEKHPARSEALASDLFRTMKTGGMIGYEEVDWFNGNLFDFTEALPLSAQQAATVRKAATLDWSEIDPAILGTLFERGLDPAKRKQLGAHYTDRDKIMRIIQPVIIRPWLAEWEKAKAALAAARKRELDENISKAARTKRRAETDQVLANFLERLRAFRVLDPACGSGNFLYLALLALKDLELRVQLEAEAMGLERGWPEIGPSSVHGIELNTFAAELARVSVWIGELQWMRRNGFGVDRQPILKPLDHIECRDALVTAEGREAGWPNADVVIGNPPFLGNRKMRRELGHDYAELLPRIFSGRVYGKPDLVCYWFAKAGDLLARKKLQSFGLVATNSIRGGTNRKVITKILQSSMVFDAWSNEPWIIDGAAVRVSLICFVRRDAQSDIHLNSVEVSQINADLTSSTFDLTRSVPMKANRGVAFQGDIKRGAFDISGEMAREWLCMPDNPNGRPNSDVLMPWRNGMDLTRRSSDRWIVQFGEELSEHEAALYETPFQYVEKYVKPSRVKNRELLSREFWFRHWNPRPEMWKVLSGLSRFIVTPTVAKHRLFAWLDPRICPDHQLIVIARDDDTTFGILHSRFHQAWSLRLGTSLENRPRYTPTTSFHTYPFPHGLSPDIRASEYAENAHALAIAAAARDLNAYRSRWLNPPEWVEWVEEPVPGYPQRPVPRSKEAAKQLKQRTLTKLYNVRPRWLQDLHEKLDAAVAAAYGWSPEITEEEFLADLLERNLA